MFVLFEKPNEFYYNIATGATVAVGDVGQAGKWRVYSLFQGQYYLGTTLSRWDSLEEAVADMHRIIQTLQPRTPIVKG